MTSQQTKLNELAAELVADDVTPELRDQATQLVMGSGNPAAKIVFIGEAPGKQEDLQGLPFVGASGKLLNELLAHAGLDRSDVYITNIVKYRPPNNRDPLPAEKAAFGPYLLRQIDIINPVIIAPLGRHSMEYFLPGTTISAVHGRPHRVTLGEQQRIVVPLFHPAAALYNRSMRQTLFDDIAQLPGVLQAALTGRQ